MDARGRTRPETHDVVHDAHRQLDDRRWLPRAEHAVRAGREHLHKVALHHHDAPGGVTVVVRFHVLSRCPPHDPRLPEVADDEPHRPAGGGVVVGVGPPQLLAGGQAGGDVGEELAAEGAGLATGGAARPEIAIALMSKVLQGVEVGAYG